LPAGGHEICPLDLLFVPARLVGVGFPPRVL